MFPLTILSAAAAAAPIFAPVAARAQPKPVSSTPATDAVAATSKHLELRSGKRLIAKRSGAAIVMPGMMRIKPMAVPVLAAQAGLDRNAQGVAAKAPSGAGTDKPGWHLVSADKHRVQGGFEFTAR